MFLKKFKAAFLLLISALLIGVSSMSCQSPQPSVNELVFRQYVADFAQSLQELTIGAKAFQQGDITQDSLKKLVVHTRMAYKNIEFWVAYKFPEFAKTNFNGAPLLQPDTKRHKSAVVPPKGLQILDEMVHAEAAFEQRSTLSALAQKLENAFTVLRPQLDLLEVSSTELVIAMRMQLVRIYALGVSGFDTPGSLNGIAESTQSLKSMLQILKTKKILPPQDTLVTDFDSAIAFLQQASDFESFDRLTFLTEHIDPLYAAMLAYQTDDLPNSLAKITAWNPKSTSLFAADFLNPYYYTELKADEDSEALRQLGKRLFYDSNLSNDGKMSCASCHQPEKAYTDGRVKSMSNIHGKSVMRNAPTLLNAVYADRYFYDLRAFSLEQQVEHVIFNPLEFNTAYSEIVSKLKADLSYVKTFAKLFGRGEVNRENFSKALASYVLSLRSFNSKFDQYVSGENHNLTALEKTGFNLFMGKAACATCHFVPTFNGLVPPYYTDSESEILGVLAQPEMPKLSDDLGRYASGIPADQVWIYKRSHKTTSVRNVELTAPYFHNGAYKMLEEVMTFYNHGGGAGIGLEVTNQTLAADSLQLTTSEIEAIIAFMKSLTDNPFAAEKVDETAQ